MRQCQQCGKDFAPQVWNQLYCSRGCWAQHKLVHDRKAHGYAAVAGTVGECAVCGTPFPRGTHNQKTCSPECRREFESMRRTRNKGCKRVTSWEAIGVCVICGAAFTRTSAQHAKKVCGEACRIAWDKERDRARWRRKRANALMISCTEQGDLRKAGEWTLPFDPYAEGMVFTGFDGVAIPATTPQALPVY